MHIVVLDGYTLNPGDLSWSGIDKLGNLTVYDRTPMERVVERSLRAEIILTNKTPITKEMIGKLPHLKYIGVLATGFDVVDVKAAKAGKIAVTNVPAYGSQSVAQMVFAHILNLTQRIGHHAYTVKKGMWAKSDDFCYWDYPLIELQGKTLGLIGAGKIGRSTALLALAFGMKVLAYKPSPIKDSVHGMEFTDMETVFRQSDFISLHCPLNEETRHIVNQERLAIMKPSSFLINTSRGPLIDEHALADALNEGRLAGAGLDVLSEEPPHKGNKLWDAKNCFITPHIAWATKAARNRLMNIVIENLKSYLIGSPQNVVNR